MNNIIHLHCIGIGGIGVSAIARLFLARGVKVSGSDIKESVVVSDLRNIGAEISIGHNAENIVSDIDLVIHTEDVNETSSGYVELQRAKELNIPTLSYSKILGQLMEGNKGIGVSGTNGKSTTTAMLGLILESAGIDPTVIVGSRVPQLPRSNFQANVRVGGGEIFLVEADEYHRHMLDANPWGIVITNITRDHLDYYKDLEDIKSAFIEYISKLPDDGVLIINAEDSVSVEIAKKYKGERLSFGFDDNANLYAKNVRVSHGQQEFELVFNDQSLGDFTLKVPGRHNLANAMAAALMALHLEVSPSYIKQSLSKFPGIWRRFEFLGNREGKIIISDYAHHPDGIEKTLEAAKQFYPNSKILTVFQPHQKNRTHNLYQEFVNVLEKCEGLIVTEIYSVVGREKIDIDISSQRIVDDLQNKVSDVSFAKDLQSAEELIKTKLNDYDLILFMGAGDIDSLARKIAS